MLELKKSSALFVPTYKPPTPKGPEITEENDPVTQAQKQIKSLQIVKKPETMKSDTAGNALILKMAGALKSKAVEEARRHNILASQAFSI